ncbi:hypothetical protein H340_09570 [Streptomyces mobaraensis NBRC 13819 = DSM 40847]|uniref:Uncharacterized protein n=1 Tax=Streptomyces mobaraensis (strain ATCC 29032 / DSM 40847 / JCM 4168 / NBRC 13819 / NCIMB 11159 / IPCR 16-22) TaxID=1223523 RepID=M3B4C6_STRM1|nr:hypothetical protein H340_09570 [Streptomyces mobaraensis NBRC 13819 = DSM 40847]
MLAGVVRLLRVLTGVVGRVRVLTRVIGLLRMLTRVVRLLRMLTGVIRRMRVLTRVIGLLRMLTRVVRLLSAGLRMLPGVVRLLLYVRVLTRVVGLSVLSRVPATGAVVAPARLAGLPVLLPGRGVGVTVVAPTALRRLLPAVLLLLWEPLVRILLLTGVRLLLRRMLPALVPRVPVLGVAGIPRLGAGTPAVLSHLSPRAAQRQPGAPGGRGSDRLVL